MEPYHMINKTIVVLANSVKHHQHCVAGKCLSSGQWVRPVSTSEGAELTHDQSTYTNPHGSYIVKPKQKIEMVFASFVPLINQPENFLITDQRWIQQYKIDDNELSGFLDNPENLWGHGNRVNYLDITQNRITITDSLYLVQVENLRLYKNEYDKRRANFIYNGTSYDLPVTDPHFNKKASEIDGVLGILCVSLGEEYQGSCYKLVATIF